MKSNKKGMSLIVLVITILVMIVIAGVVVLGLVENNPIEKAREAKIKAMANAVKSDFTMFCTTITAKMGKVIDLDLLEATKDDVKYNGKDLNGYDTVYDILPSLEKNNEDFVVTKGKLLYVGEKEEDLDYIEDVGIEMLYRPSLITEPHAEEDYIYLEWAVIDTSEAYKYKVYQKTEDSDEFQTISTTDFNSLDPVKVLNVYPDSSTSETFTNYEGKNFTLPYTARLKRWMEEPKAGYPKGYGNGIIKVDAVSMSEFNQNSSEYLKKVTSQEWSYNVVMVGSWDSNGWQDLSSSATTKIREFISSGGGFLSGHDSISGLQGLENLRTISQYLNMKPSGAKYYNGIEAGGGPVAGNSKIKIVKKGQLINYPWKVGDIGDNLSVPSTHSLGQQAFGNIWMRFNYNEMGMDDPGNVYLTSWNNVAMIQTGHSNGDATEDEQKVLANTLFYLNQLGKKNYLDDHSGQDVKAPEKPKIKDVKIENNEAFVEIEETKDLGSTYTYYIASEGEITQDERTSRVKSQSIESGFAGYIVDISSSETPNLGESVNLTSQTFRTNASAENIYLHIASVDKVGNKSEVTTYKIK